MPVGRFISADWSSSPTSLGPVGAALRQLPLHCCVFIPLVWYLMIISTLWDQYHKNVNRITGTDAPELTVKKKEGYMLQTWVWRKTLPTFTLMTTGAYQLKHRQSHFRTQVGSRYSVIVFFRSFLALLPGLLPPVFDYLEYNWGKSLVDLTMSDINVYLCVGTVKCTLFWSGPPSFFKFIYLHTVYIISRPLPGLFPCFCVLKVVKNWRVAKALERG